MASNPALTKEGAIALQEEFLFHFRSKEFKRELRRILERDGRGTRRAAEAVQALCLPLQAAVLPKYGFEGSRSGLSQLELQLRSLELDDAVLLACNRVRVSLGLPARKRAAVRRANAQDQTEGRGVFDWGFLALREEETLAQSPCVHIIGGQSCRVYQRRLPDAAEPEVTGLQAWPSAVALARFLEAAAYAATRDSPVGRTVLELGAGVGLVALAALALGARRVVATELAAARRRLAISVGMNSWAGAVEVEELDWREVAAGGPSPTGPFDLILWADCVFWPELFEPLCGAVARLSSRSTAVLFALPNRGTATTFLELLARSFRVEEVWTKGELRIYRARKI